jgi:2-oxoisovalerate dehydrogenase E1 component alpha subunit
VDEIQVIAPARAGAYGTPRLRNRLSYLHLSPAGATRRRSVGTSPVDTDDFAYSLVRVLDDSGQAVEPWAPKDDPEDLRRGLRAMIKTRIFDTHMLVYQRQKKISRYIQCLGEESVAATHSQAPARKR